MRTQNPSRGAISRRSFLKQLGTAVVAAPFITSCAVTRPRINTLRHASFGAGGMAWADLTQIAKCPNVEIVAVCDVDLDRMVEARKQFPNARFYQDWRELLDKEYKNIDSVNVSTPDHMHAPIGVSAMQLGKHLYGQKPLAHELYEVRRMTEIARHTGVVTQMGIQIHSDVHYRMAVQVIQDGAIGKIREVHSWCNKAWGDAAELPDRMDAIPPNLAWDLWLGVCATRPFLGNGYYHPGNWRKRLDFGTGTLGDMACHILDPVFESIGLKAPVSVRSEGARPNRTNWVPNGKVVYVFPGTPRTAGDRVTVTWYDGTNKPPADIIALLEKENLPEAGSIFVGSKGAMLLPHYDMPVLFPTAQFQDFKLPKLAGIKHWEQFVEACRGNDRTQANFDYAGPLTETVLLGGVASRFPQLTLGWNGKKLKFDHAEANQYVRREYRHGWEVKGL